MEKNQQMAKFESGDKIYHPFYGWGIVVKHEGYTYLIDHGQQTHHNGDNYVEKMYSFREYNLVDGGWSQNYELRKSAGEQYKAQHRREIEHEIAVLTKRLSSI